MTRILIMAGGTGGHIYPALAVADELLSRGVQVIWLGTRKGLEASIVPMARIDMEWITITGLRGKSAGQWLVSPFKSFIAMMQALAVIVRRRPMVVLGMGGFVTGPGGLVTCLLHKPLVIHEQNAVAGLTNRLLARCANRILQAFANTFPARVHAITTGNPVRKQISALPPPEVRLKNRRGPLRLLVLGGSQGAEALNKVVPLALQTLAAERRPQVWHQAGSRHKEQTEQRYRAAGISAAHVMPFIEDMAAAYAWADLVLCRAGALTIAELTAVGVGAILVPYPHAVDDHQAKNAALLADAGAAIVLREDELTHDKLCSLLCQFTGEQDNLSASPVPPRAGSASAGSELPLNSSPPAETCQTRLLMMATEARRLSCPEAAERVAEVCLQLAAVS